MVNKVVLVGRPNVGKSSLINALVHRQAAIVDDLPGVTRDIVYFPVLFGDFSFSLADSGGLHLDKETDLFQADIEKLVMRELKDADLIIFLTDGREGATPLDQEIASKLRKQKLLDKTLIVANKVDHDLVPYANLYKLGVKEILPISAAHRIGLNDLLSEIKQRLEKSVVPQDSQIKVTIVGRPNAGKSSLLNALLDKPRALVSNISGTTRDPVNDVLDYKGTLIEFIDTAGFRHKTTDDIEYYSMDRAYKAIDHSDIALLIFDPEEFANDLEQKLARYLEKVRKGLIFVVNKEDIIKPEFKENFDYKIRERFYYLGYAPVIYVSALKKKGLHKLLPLITRVHRNYSQEIPTSYLNKVVEQIYKAANPPSKKGQVLKIYFVSQVKSAPPYFVFSVNHPELVIDSYEKYLERSFREHFQLDGIPIKFKFKKH